MPGDSSEALCQVLSEALCQVIFCFVRVGMSCDLDLESTSGVSLDEDGCLASPSSLEFNAGSSSKTDSDCMLSEDGDAEVDLGHGLEEAGREGAGAWIPGEHLVFSGPNIFAGSLTAYMFLVNIVLNLGKIPRDTLKSIVGICAATGMVRGVSWAQRAASSLLRIPAKTVQNLFSQFRKDRVKFESRYKLQEEVENNDEGAKNAEGEFLDNDLEASNILSTMVRSALGIASQGMPRSRWLDELARLELSGVNRGKIS